MNQSSDMTRIKKTISDLLNLADNDAAFDQEAENALRFARKLMLRHGIEQCDLEEKRDASSIAAVADVEYGLKHCYSEAKTLSKWEESLANTIASIVGTVQWFKQTKVEKKTKAGTVAFNDKTGEKVGLVSSMSFYGPDADCIDAIDLLEEWRQVVIAMARLKYGGVFRGPGRSYCEGFANSLRKANKRIKHLEHQQMMELDSAHRSNALMIINANAIAHEKKERAASWLQDEKKIKLRSAPQTSYRKHFGDAYVDGQTDGKKANLSHSRRRRLEG